MKKYLIYIFITAAFVFTNACSEEFITQELPSGISAATFYKTQADMDKAMVAVYNTLTQLGSYRRNWTIVGGCPSDNVDLNGDNGGPGLNASRLDKYSYDEESLYLPELWITHYAGIAQANTLIKYVPDAMIPEDLKKNYAAQAIFLRSLFHFNLAICFGDIPLIRESLPLDDYYKLNKTPHQEVIETLCSDLQTAANDLPETQPQVGMADKGAALALLSRVALFAKDYPKVIKAVEDFGKITGKQYGLYGTVAGENYKDLFNNLAQNTRENVFDMKSANTGIGILDVQGSGLLFAVYANPIQTYCSNFPAPSLELLKSFEAGDIRREASILIAKTIVTENITYNATDKFDINADGVGENFPATGMRGAWKNNMNIRKYLPQDIQFSGFTDRNNSYNINFCIIRYAEVLLNYAEALNLNNQSGAALVPLNKIRSRANLPAIAETDKVKLDKIIFNERRVELCFEGHRFFDLVRTDKATEFLSSSGFIKGKHDYFPIPKTEIDINPNLGK